MNITVLGLWHLGCVTAACSARHFPVKGLDFDAARIARLADGAAPFHEPGLDERLREGVAAGRLRFTGDAEEACRGADILWVTIDTPVDENDEADTAGVMRDIRRCVPLLPSGALVLLSSQLPAGTCRQLESEFSPAGYRFACSPENLRLGQALACLENADRIVAGCRDERTRTELDTLLRRFTNTIIWMRPESAEMTKHALNAFLALSITFMNEVARIGESVGADAREVERGLKSDNRIGPRAYVSPGAAFAGGTLARDVAALSRLAADRNLPLELIPAVKQSNDVHRRWPWEKIQRHFAGAAGIRIALLGLTYKPGTSTLRRSAAVELARTLKAGGFEVRASDPSQSALPDELAFICLMPTVADATDGADAAVLCTPWPEFRQADWPAIVARMRQPFLIDAGRFLESCVADLPRIHYVTLGSPA